MYFRKILKAASFIQCLPLPPAPPPSLKDLGTSIKTEIKKHSFYQPSERAHKEHHPDRCWVVVVMVCFICICPGGGSDGEESACNAGDSGSIPGLGRSPGGGHGNHSRNSLAWRIPWAEEPGGLQPMGSAKSQERLND